MATPFDLAEMRDVVPHRAVASETLADGRVVLLRPKFTSPRWQWLQRRLTKPFWRVRLDEIGSCLWEHLDGDRTFPQLCEILATRFGDRVRPAEQRTWPHLLQLVQGGFVTLTRVVADPDPPAHGPS